MKLKRALQASALCMLLAHCGDDDGGNDVPVAGPDGGLDAGHGGDIDAGVPDAPARIQTQVTAAGGKTAAVNKFKAGAATLESLRYYITSIQICETLQVQGSGFSQPTGCVELYRNEIGSLAYGLNDDWRPLGDLARRSDEGFVDLMNASSRAALSSSTTLTAQHVRSYNYGIINWALPIKVRARVPFLDGTTLYTHDGVSSFETIGVDNYRSYFTNVTTPLDRGPAEDAVVLLPNGGNWFKFQTPLTITSADIEARRAFVLDLVFNPEGIVNGYAEGFAQGSLSQRGAGGQHVYDITVPMLDLAPVPHRADQQVVRESYRGTSQIDGSPYDLRIELYTVEGNASVFGADMKTLVNPASTQVPPVLAKASFVDVAADGSLSFSSYKHTPVVTGMQRVTTIGGTTHVGVKCAEHTDRAGAEGGAAIVANRCPSETIDVTLTLVSRNIVEGNVPVTASDAGVAADAALGLDAN